jgi:hypothetical protein
MESGRLYEKLSPEERDQVLTEAARLLSDHRTAPRQKKMKASDARLPKN